MDAIILIVSQSESIRMAAWNILSPINYRILSSFDIFEAQDCLLTNFPDLIYIDANVDHCIDFIAASKETGFGPSAPIVLISRADNIRIKESALEVGVDDFISDPLEKTTLITRTRNILSLNSRRNPGPRPVEMDDFPIQNNMQSLQRTTFCADTIQHLVMACALRDKKTCAHAIRVAYYSAAIARKIGMNSIAVDAVFNAASMHDVGKIGVPDNVLLKPARLNYDETRVVRQHAGHGQMILEGSRSEFVQIAESVAICHHERMDGSGYPNNKKGDDIPVPARIVAVADVFDALISRRCYKQPYPIDKANQLIREGTGNHFDPMVVQAFFEVQNEILASKDKYNDDFVYDLLLKRDFVLMKPDASAMATL